MTLAEHECNPCMHNFLKELPKCEHHLHLEGTLEPDLLFKMAKRNNIELPSTFPSTIEQCKEKYNDFSDLQDFLNHYYVGMSVLMTETDFYDLAMAYFAKAKTDGCLHSEVFFDPQGHIERGISLDVVVSGFNRACQDATSTFGTTNKLIMCLLRHLPCEDGIKVIELAGKYYQDGTIHGLGLDSSEKPFPPDLFEECYSFLKGNFPHVQLTAHAGEEGDHTFVERSLDKLKVTRIDHGVNSQHSESLLQRLNEKQIMLSLCPLSNVKLQVVQDVGHLPIDLFLKKGVPFSINSDDPAYFGGYILDNYVAVHTRFGFSMEQWKQISLNGINGSWCDNDRKQELRQLVEEVCRKYSKVL